MSVELKLQRFTKAYPLKSCNFKKECVPNLIYDEVIVNGLITKELYYADVNKTELVIDVEINYIYGEDTLVSQMEYNINYYTDPVEAEEESVIGMTIIKRKVLTKRQKLSLLKKRRKTIRQYCEAAVLGLLQQVYPEKTVPEIMQMGGVFLIDNDTSLDHYEKVGSPKIVMDLMNNTKDDWLDSTPYDLGGATIRQYLIGSLSA